MRPFPHLAASESVDFLTNRAACGSAGQNALCSAGRAGLSGLMRGGRLRSQMNYEASSSAGDTQRSEGASVAVGKDAYGTSAGN